MSLFVQSFLSLCIDEFHKPKRDGLEFVFWSCRLAFFVEFFSLLFSFKEEVDSRSLFRIVKFGEECFVVGRVLPVFYSLSQDFLSRASVLFERFVVLNRGVDLGLLEELFSVRRDGLLGVGVSFSEIGKVRRLLE